MSDKQLDRISYSEGAKINTGDYESRDVHISYSFSVDVPKGTKVKDALNKAKKVVQGRLKVAEKRIREASEEDVDFESMDKLSYYD